MSEAHIACAPAETVRAGVNERQFFKSLKHLFAGSFSMIGELMQNGRRAGATEILFDFDPAASTLVIADDGHGIKDFNALIQLAQSGWDEQTMLNEQPFGMGLFSLFFAAQEVTFRSGGKRLALTLDDVVEKRELTLYADDGGPEVGTRIELRNLSTALMEKHFNHIQRIRRFGTLAEYTLCNAIQLRAAGFAIPVLLNGIEFDRSYAQENLAGEMTEIGFVSIPGIHRETGGPIQPARGTSGTMLFLQGLPIGGAHAEISQYSTVIHLSTDQFSAKMPDRAYLYEPVAAEKRINGVIKQLIAAHLKSRKAAMTHREFVLRHWQNCVDHGALTLMNDVPWLPIQCFKAASQVTKDSEANYDSMEVFKLLGVSDEQHLVSFTEIENGTVKVWRCAPWDVSDTPMSALLLNIMQREGIVTTAMQLPAEHWLHGCTPDTDDFRYTINVENARGNAVFDAWDWVQRCEIQLADRVDVKIASQVDPAFNLEVSIRDEWVLLPIDYKEHVLDRHLDFDSNHETVCFVLTTDNTRGHPVDAFSDYRDENEAYREEWRDGAMRRWNAKVSGLLGESIALVVASALGNAPLTPADSHIDHLAIVRTTRHWLENGAPSAPRFAVTCAQDSAFWERLADELAGRTSEDEPLAQRLKSAFAAVMRPGEILGEKPAKT